MNIKRGDTYPPLRVTMTDSTLAPVDLTDCTVKFRMVNSDMEVVIADKAATVVNAVAGIVEYVWAAGDTDVAGYFQGEFEVSGWSGKVGRFPNYTFEEIIITDRLPDPTP